ncbi:hypothetical protein HZB89_01490, partial [archaeon]|nr:hypothetical protein [archaeon]
LALGKIALANAAPEIIHLLELAKKTLAGLPESNKGLLFYLLASGKILAGENLKQAEDSLLGLKKAQLAKPKRSLDWLINAFEMQLFLNRNTN